MATIGSIKNEMHIAGCDQLSVLKLEADQFAVDNPTLLQWFINHVYREYNRRKFYYCGGADMITPYDSGFRPYSYTPNIDLGDGDFFLLENGDPILLENGDNLTLQHS